MTPKPADTKTTDKKAADATTSTPTQRDLRLRDRFFPDADAVIFHTKSKAYGPLPILTRKLLRHITPPELRVYIYLLTRSGKYRMCFPTMEEIAGEVGVTRKNLTAPIKKLEKIKMIATRQAEGRRYFLIHDPRVAIQHLVDEGTIQGDELFMLNELCDDLGQPRFVKPKASKP